MRSISAVSAFGFDGILFATSPYYAARMMYNPVLNFNASGNTFFFTFTVSTYSLASNGAFVIFFDTVLHELFFGPVNFFLVHEGMIYRNHSV